MRRMIEWWRWRREVAAARRDTNLAWERVQSARSDTGYPLGELRQWQRLRDFELDLRDAGPWRRL